MRSVGWTLSKAVGKRTVRLAAMATCRTRGTPTFLLIGAKRGGTTTLYRLLESHRSYVPLVPSSRTLPMRENMKGVHYFDTNYDRSDRWYRSHFPMAASMRRHALRHGAAFTGDGSPYYLFHPLAAERAAESVPNAMIIVLLRDPIERTVSHWAEQTRNGIETLTLADALAREASRIGDDCELLTHDRIVRSFAHEHQSYASQSEYGSALSRWMAHFQRARVRVLFSEDLYRDAADTLLNITDFIGIDPLASSEAIRKNAAARHSELDPEIRAQLIARFTPDARRVAELVGRTPPWPWFTGSDQCA